MAQLPDRNRWGLLPHALIAPLVAVELAVHVVPMVLGGALSLRKVNQFTLRDWLHAPHIGFDNYRAVLDPGTAIGARVLTALGVTLAFTMVVVLVSWLLGMFAAVLLSQPFRGRAVLTTVFIIPFAVPAFVTGAGWRVLFAHDDGAVNHLLVDGLQVLGARPFWLVGDLAFWAATIASVWRLWPFAFLMLAPALATVPKEHYEEAAVHGAGAWQQFRRVTLPALRGPNLIILVAMSLWTFNEFTIPWVLFGGVPPASADLISTLAYREAFGTLNVGQAAAINLATAATSLVAVGAWFRIRRRALAESVA